MDKFHLGINWKEQAKQYTTRSERVLFYYLWQLILFCVFSISIFLTESIGYHLHGYTASGYGGGGCRRGWKRWRGEDGCGGAGSDVDPMWRPTHKSIHRKGVVAYKSIVNEDEREDLLRYWRENAKTFPTLSKMVRDVLNIQALSTASERFFFS